MEQPVGTAYVQPVPGGYADVPPAGYAYSEAAPVAGTVPLAEAPVAPPLPAEPQYAPPAEGQLPAEPSVMPEGSPQPPAVEQPAVPPVTEQPSAPTTRQQPEQDAAAEPQASESTGQTAFPPDQVQIEEYGKRMDEGAAAFATGNFDKARHAFVLAMLAIPDSVDAKLAYAITQFATGDYRVAAILLQQVIPAHPEVVHSDFDLRERYEDKKTLVRQVEALRAYIKAHPKELEPMLVLGFVQHFSDEGAAAQQTFAEVLKLSPKEPVASIFLDPPPLAAPATQPASPEGAATTQPAAGMPGE